MNKFLSFLYYFASNFCENAKMICLLRETREGWPLLTGETEATGDLWSTNEGGPFSLSWLVRWFFILPWLLWSAQVKMYLFLTAQYLNFCVTIYQQRGQAVVHGLFLWVCVSSSPMAGRVITLLDPCRLSGFGPGIGSWVRAWTERLGNVHNGLSSQLKYPLINTHKPAFMGPESQSLPSLQVVHMYSSYCPYLSSYF